VTRVHPSAVIGPGVQLAPGVIVGPHAVLLGPCEVREGAWIGAGAIVGAPPGDVAAPHRSWDEPQGGGVVVGERARVREHAQIESGQAASTIVGPDAFVMPHAHLSHDCVLGTHVVIASGAVLGGTVRVGDHVFVGLNTSVHQRVVIGAHAVVGLQSAVVDDIPPFARAAGSPARILGVNHVGMRRRGLDRLAPAAEEILLRGGAPGDASVADELADRFSEFAAWRRGSDRRTAKVAR